MNAPSLIPAANEPEVLRCGAAELARRLARGEITAVDVVTAFLARIEHTHPALNAFVARQPEAALAAARRADERRARGEPLGPLHGVPCTVKQCFAVAGLPQNMGLDTLAGKVATADAPLVARLRRAGGIMLGVTNVPQLMVLHDSVNPVYGRTHNPWSSELPAAGVRSAGGSTGGEAAALAAGCSALGLGSDLGGSLRVPAHFCGVQSFKPTPRRLTRLGSLSTFRGMNAMLFQPGPLARKVEDLELAMRVLCAEFPGGEQVNDGDALDPEWDRRPFQINAPESLAGLRVGVCLHDGFFTPSPAVRRAVDEAAQALEARGAVLEPYTPPGMPEPVLLYAGIMTADGGADLKRWASGNRLDPEVARMLAFMGWPRWLRRVVGWPLRASGQARQAEALLAGGPRSAGAYWQLAHARAEYEGRFLADWRQRQLAAVILPPYALPAILPKQSVDLMSAASYAFLANVVGLPAGVVAATRVRAGEEHAERKRGDWVERAAWQTEEQSAGLPVGVQVLTPPWHDALALRIMQALEDHFRAQPDYPLYCR